MATTGTKQEAANCPSKIRVGLDFEISFEPISSAWYENHHSKHPGRTNYRLWSNIFYFIYILYCD